MKRVEIITRPYKLDEIKEALTSMGIQGMTVTDVRGFGRQRGHKEVYRGAEYQVDFVSKVKIEIVIDDDLLDQTLEVIQQAAKTGKIGDGKIFVSKLKLKHIITIILHHHIKNNNGRVQLFATLQLKQKLLDQVFQADTVAFKAGATATCNS